MSKHKKTRSEKIISDLRKKLQTANKYSLETINQTEKKTDQDKQTKIKNNYQLEGQNIKMISYTNTFYLTHDLLKTGLLTSGIVIFQLILFFLLKNHVIASSIAGF
jgi:hypothetical protein